MSIDFEKYIGIVERQDKALRFDKFDSGDAFKLCQIIMELVQKQYGRSVSIRVDLDNITTLYYLMGNSSLGNDYWMQKKLNGCMQTGNSSFMNYLKIEGLDKMDEFPWAKNQGSFALRGGCVPIRLKDGSTKGFCMVSGLIQAQDHQLVADALASLLGVEIETVLDGTEFVG